MAVKLDITNVALTRGYKSYTPSLKDFGFVTKSDDTHEIRVDNYINDQVMIWVLNNISGHGNVSDVTYVEAIIEKLSVLDVTNLINLYNFDEQEIFELQEHENVASWTDSSQIFVLLVSGDEDNDSIKTGKVDSTYDNFYNIIAYDYSTTSNLVRKFYIRDNTESTINSNLENDLLLIFQRNTSDNTTIYSTYSIDSFKLPDITSQQYQDSSLFFIHHPQFQLTDTQHYDLSYNFDTDNTPSGAVVLEYTLSSQEPHLFVNKVLTYDVTTSHELNVSLVDSDGTTLFSNTHSTTGQYAHPFTMKEDVDYHFRVECDDLTNGFVGTFSTKVDFTIYNYLPGLYFPTLNSILTIVSNNVQPVEESEAESRYIFVDFGLPLSIFTSEGIKVVSFVEMSSKDEQII